MTKRKSKGAYMISSVAEMYGIHPQTLRLYEREGLLKPSRTEGNTRLYTDEDLAASRIHSFSGARSGCEHRRHGHHPANARTHGRNAAPDSGVRAVHPAGSSHPRQRRRRSLERRNRARAKTDGRTQRAAGTKEVIAVPFTAPTR